jgi:hypothetical protein
VRANSNAFPDPCPEPRAAALLRSDPEGQAHRTSSHGSCDQDSKSCGSEGPRCTLDGDLVARNYVDCRTLRRDRGRPCAGAGGRGSPRLPCARRRPARRASFRGRRGLRTQRGLPLGAVLHSVSVRLRGALVAKGLHEFPPSAWRLYVCGEQLPVRRPLLPLRWRRVSVRLGLRVAERAAPMIGERYPSEAPEERSALRRLGR